MNEMPSAEFRKQYAKLKEETIVTVNGHSIGLWVPGWQESKGPLIPGKVWASATQEQRDEYRRDYAKSPQQARDDLLHKINRAK
jgi:hypothetical protein